MAELSQEEKDKQWADLKEQWKIVKGKGEGAEKAKKRINMIQKILDLEITDFDKEDPTKEVKVYTDAEAEEQFTDEMIELMRKAVKRSVGIKHVMAGMAVEEDPKLKGNAPGIGQHVNISYDLCKDDLKELMKKNDLK